VITASHTQGDAGSTHIVHQSYGTILAEWCAGKLHGQLASAARNLKNRAYSPEKFGRANSEIFIKTPEVPEISAP